MFKKIIQIFSRVRKIYCSVIRVVTQLVAYPIKKTSFQRGFAVLEFVKWAAVSVLLAL